MPQLEEAAQYTRDDATFILVGNKSDLADE